MKLMLSKYASTCTACNLPVKKGDWIGWSRQTGARHANGQCCHLYPVTAPQDVRAACWDCKSPEGRFRPYGAATPVYCDACHAKHKPEPDWTDTAYEDQCAAICGR